LGRSSCWRRILKSEILASQRGLVEAGKEYLRHLLSPKQLAPYRVVARDAGRFPELGLEYQKLLVTGRTEILLVLKLQLVVRDLRFSYPDSGRPLTRRDSHKGLM